MRRVRIASAVLLLVLAALALARSAPPIVNIAHIGVARAAIHLVGSPGERRGMRPAAIVSCIVAAAMAVIDWFEQSGSTTTIAELLVQ